jgi:hypothetical protein
MARDDLRAGGRAAFVVTGLGLTGLGLIGLAVLLALRSASDMTSLAALLAGVLLLVVAGVGRLPEELGLQRILFGHPPPAAREYRKALCDAVQTALPEVDPPIRGDDWQPDRPTYRVDELQLKLVVTWAPDDSYRMDVSRIDPGAQSDSEVGPAGHQRGRYRRSTGRRCGRGWVSGPPWCAGARRKPTMRCAERPANSKPTRETRVLSRQVLYAGGAKTGTSRRLEKKPREKEHRGSVSALRRPPIVRLPVRRLWWLLWTTCPDLRVRPVRAGGKGTRLSWCVR